MDSYEHEDEGETAVRRGRNLEAIFRVCPQSEISKDGVVTSVVDGKKFNFWPGSDCWYSHAKDRYGHGILKLLEKIEKLLVEAKVSGDSRD